MSAAPSSRDAGIPLVSILVNNHGYAEYVCDAVRSGLSQTHPAVEVIVVDDGSADDSLAMLATIRDPRLTVVSQPNLGQAAAYNAGWSRARGDFAIFLDADDLLDADVVARCVAEFERGTVKVQFRLRVIDAAGRSSGALHPPDPIDVGDCRGLVLRFGQHASPPGSGNCYRRAYLEQVMPIPDPAALRTASDAWCILMAPFFGGIRSLGRPGGSYRVVRPAGVDALRMIGNANSRPARNARVTVATTAVVFAELRRRGLIDADRPALPPPWLLRAWMLARLDGEPLRPDALWGIRPSPATIVRSVLGWPAYGPAKRIVYAGYLLIGCWLPPRLAKSAVRAASRLRST